MRRVLLTLAAPLMALTFAVAVTWGMLAATGNDALDTFRQMYEYGIEPDSLVLTVNLATTYYLAAIAVAVGFRMNLFNIGVDGQYRLAALLAAYVGGSAAGWPIIGSIVGAPGIGPIFHVALILLVAMVVGASWAAVAAVLKNRRGVSEVISTIMLNYIATGIIAYLLNPSRLAVEVQGSNNIGTPPIPPSGQVPGFTLFSDATTQVYGLVVLAIVCGVGYWFLMGFTRFGFDLRVTGASPTAAVASGVNVKRMVLSAMVISGAVAGLIGMPQLLGASHTYNLDFPTGLGFTGIAIALLGRNHPVGMLFGALLWAFLDSSRQILDLTGVSKEIVTIMQAVAVLSVVIAYELVRRYSIVAQQRQVGTKLAELEAASA